MTIERVGWYSASINILLALLNLAISLAAAAEMVHDMMIKTKPGQRERSD